MAKIVTVYNTERRAADLLDMSYIRWFRLSEALARLGHEVDIATAEFKWRLRRPIVPMSPRLRRVPLSRVRWRDYDVVKALFHQGFTTLERYGGADHPFVIVKLGSVVGATDLPGVYFYGRARRRLYDVQRRIAARARYLTLLTEAARGLWRECHGERGRELLVPGAADAVLPPPGPDPYPPDDAPRCVFAGNIYDRRTQPEANRVLVEKLNDVGRRLAARGIRLFLVGPGDTHRLDPAAVTYLGAVPYVRSWDYLHHAQAGLLVAAGPFMHNNESSKIYHYLRAGLPIVSERGFPNDWVIEESGLGTIVANGDVDGLAGAVVSALTREWDRARATAYVLARHTWDARAAVYDEVLRAELGFKTSPGDS